MLKKAGDKLLGYAGKLLYVDLGKGSFEGRETPAQLAQAFLGGRGLGAALLYKELELGIDPLGPKNILIFMTGLADGTLLPSSPRWVVVTKSPLTGMYLCNSAGGFFGPELKFAGYDGIVIKGKAKSPVYLYIKDGKMELRDAKKLWGKMTDETEQEIRKELKDNRVRVACVGPAGENFVKYANIQSDLRSIGRGGAGAVMASKNLKAVAVRGHGKFEVADEEGLAILVRELRMNMKESEAVQDFTKWGTMQFVDVINEAGLLPTRNFQEGVFEGARKINAETIRKMVKRNTACFGCPVACGKYSIVADGKYAGTMVEGPEYETIWSFGAHCGVDDLEAIAAANMWCDKYGIDTISAGNTIGFAMECYERGLLTKKDTDGLELKFGNHEVFLPSLKKIALREGIGDLLAEGVREMAKRLKHGTENFAMHVKGMELPAYDPRGAWGMGVAYATSCRGGCHLKAWTLGVEVMHPKYDRFSSEGKGKLVFELQNERAINDSIGVCTFGSRAIGVDEMVKMVTVLTGWNFNSKKLLEAGERIYNVERLIATREGVARKDDTLPPRLLTDVLPHGPSKGVHLRREDLDQMLNEYYAVRGWDRNGKPTKAKLEELGILKLFWR